MKPVVKKIGRFLLRLIYLFLKDKTEKKDL